MCPQAKVKCQGTSKTLHIGHKISYIHETGIVCILMSFRDDYLFIYMLAILQIWLHVAVY